MQNICIKNIFLYLFTFPEYAALSIYLKGINTFIKQGCIKFIKSKELYCYRIFLI